MSTTRILVGDVRTRLAEIPDESVQTCVTSPPYWGLRDYGHDGQIGLEQTPEEYVAEMVAVFREVRRALRDDGTLWLNLGDSYAGGGGFSPNAPSNRKRRELLEDGKHKDKGFSLGKSQQIAFKSGGIRPQGHIKPKDLVGIPWRLAFALQADGWFLRSDIIWAKPNPMPESVRDRPTKAHEYVFLLSKSGRYFWDADAIREPHTFGSWSAKGDAAGRTRKGSGSAPPRGGEGVPGSPSGMRGNCYPEAGRNARTVWTIATQPFPGSHFAVMPPELAERCIKAGSAKDDTVLDPFGGAGTTALVANRLKRNAVICELNRDYARMARKRIVKDQGLFADVKLIRQKHQG